MFEEKCFGCLRLGVSVREDAARSERGECGVSVSELWQFGEATNRHGRRQSFSELWKSWRSRILHSRRQRRRS